MKTHFNNNEYAKRMVLKMQKLATCLPPAILFEKSEKKSDKSDNDKDQYKSFEMKINKREKDSDKVEQKVKVFENGTPEEYCIWCERYNELQKSIPLDTPTKQIKVIRSILKESYLDVFNNYISNVEDADSENPVELTNDHVQEALDKVTLKVFNSPHAYRRQVRYMRYQLYFTTTNFADFLHRLKQLNKYLKYFPVPPQKEKVASLTDDDLIEIIDNAKPFEYNEAMLKNNYDPYDKNLEEFSQYMERLEQAEKFKDKLSGKKRKERPTSTKERKTTTGKLHKCKYCKKMVTHDDDDCWEKPGNKHLKPSWAKSKKFKTSHSSSSSKKKTPTFTGEQLSFLIDNAHVASKKKTKKVKKRKIVYQHSESESDASESAHMVTKMSEVVDSDEVTNYSSEESEEYFLTQNYSRRTKKKFKTGHLTTEVIGEIVSRDQKVTPMRCLLDTGTTSTIIQKKYVNKLSKFKHAKTTWNTMGGQFKTRRKAQIEFKLPEFSHNKTIRWVDGNGISSGQESRKL